MLFRSLYRDSVYTLCWRPYPELSILGYTSASGSFSTIDSLRFPNVLTLPPLIHTGESGSGTLGTFSLSDTLVFVLTDTASHRQQSFERVVHKATNNSLSFAWQPTATYQATPIIKQESPQLSKIEIVRPAAPELAWKLNQNYPNPYYR